jgi:antitoxin FitA
MPNVQIRDVPDDVHQTLVRRAERNGHSLQQYLSLQLRLLAATPTVDEVIDRIEGRTKGSLSIADALEAVEAERDRRGE